ncbi:Hypothetical predicted protein, partial [Scomber scombrus]
NRFLASAVLQDGAAGDSPLPVSTRNDPPVALSVAQGEARGEEEQPRRAEIKRVKIVFRGC